MLPRTSPVDLQRLGWCCEMIQVIDYGKVVDGNGNATNGGKLDLLRKCWQTRYLLVLNVDWHQKKPDFSRSPVSII